MRQIERGLFVDCGRRRVASLRVGAGPTRSPRRRYLHPARHLAVHARHDAGGGSKGTRSSERSPRSPGHEARRICRSASSNSRLRKPNVPRSCIADRECAGAGGPCTLKWCSKYSSLVPNGIAACNADTDCKAIPTLADYGPCANAACTADTTKKCTTDADCKLSTPFDFGTCVAIGHCSAAASVACSSLNTPCGPDANGVDRGTCTTATSSFCFHGTECSQAAYAAPAVEIQALPAASTALLASLTAQQPDGDTPTGPARRGAITPRARMANAHPGHTVVAVLAHRRIADRVPSDDVGFAEPRRSTPVKEVEGVAADASWLTEHPTFVIGVFSGADTRRPRTSSAWPRRADHQSTARRHRRGR